MGRETRHVMSRWKIIKLHVMFGMFGFSFIPLVHLAIAFSYHPVCVFPAVAVGCMIAATWDHWQIEFGGS